MTDRVNGDPEIDKADWMRGQMVMAVRELENRFPGACVTVFVSAPGAGKGTGLYSHATSAEPADLAAVLREHLAEIDG